MADPTITSATLLCSAKGNSAGQIQWWLFNIGLAVAQTSINVTKLKEAGPGTGTLIGLIDAGGVDSGKGAIVLDGAVTGLTLAADSTTEIKFFNTQDGANGAATKEITALDLAVVFAV
jgi:hypothetical protein